VILFETTLGNITLELFETDAPETTANFKQYVEDGFYNGTIFHRVIDGFMIQGGGFEPGMGQKDTRDPIKNEASNGLANNRGTIAMARTMDPHSATAQFFINVADNDFLNFRSETPMGSVIVFLDASSMGWMLWMRLRPLVQPPAADTQMFPSMMSSFKTLP